MRTSADRWGRSSLFVVAMLAAAWALGGCAGSSRAPFDAEPAPAATLDAIEGDWTPTREGARVREIEFERTRSGWMLEVERHDDVGNEVEESYPARLIAIDGRTILEVEIARGRTPGPEGTSAAAFFYSSVAVEDETLRSSALNPDWLREYAQTHPALKVAAVNPWGSEQRALGVGRADGLAKMIQAAAADEKAWGPASVWTREQKD